MEISESIRKASGRYCLSCFTNKPKELFKGRKCDDCQKKYSGKRVAVEAERKAVA